MQSRRRCVAFTLDGSPVRIYLNPFTLLPTAVDCSGPAAHGGFWSYLGDITQRTYYSYWWLAKGGIHLPMQSNVRQTVCRIACWSSASLNWMRRFAMPICHLA